MDAIKNFCKKVKWEALIASLFVIAIGILFVTLPESSAQTICYVAGAMFILLGVMLLLRYCFAYSLFGSYVLILSIMLMFVGLLTLIRPDLVQGIITFIFGIYLVAEGAIQIQNAIECKKARAKGAWAFVVSAILSITLGVMIMLNTFTSVMIFCGISLIVDGVCDFIVTIVFSAKVKKAHNSIKEIMEDAE